MSGPETLPVSAIRPNPGQPRRLFAAAALQELADSIASVGLLSPIVVRPVPSRAGDPGHWEIVAGERRWRAAQMVGLGRVPVVIREDLEDLDAFTLAMVENVIRADMTPVEEARGYQQLMDAGLSPAQIAERLGKSLTAVHYRLALLRLAPDILRLVETGNLGERDGWQMSRLSTEGQYRVIRAMGAGELRRPGDLGRLVSAIETEEQQAPMFAEDEVPAIPPERIRATRTLEDHLRAALEALEKAAALADQAEASETAEAQAREVRRQAGALADRMAARRLVGVARQTRLPA